MGMANSGDPDQTAPPKEQSDLGLHSLLRHISPKNLFTEDEQKLPTYCDLKQSENQHVGTVLYGKLEEFLNLLVVSVF